MKTFLIVSCLLATAAASNTLILGMLSEVWKDKIAECCEQNGYSDSMTLHDMYEIEEANGDTKRTCMHACVLKSVGVDPSGIDKGNLIEAFVGVFSAKAELIRQLKKAVTHCAPEVATIEDECEKAYLYFKCSLYTNYY